MRPSRSPVFQAPMFCLLLLVAVTATAAGKRQQEREAVRQRAESSMTVTGTIDITPAGDVVGFALDDPEKLPKGIVAMTGQLAPRWKFEPVPLQENAYSRSRMTLVYVAKRLDGDRYEIGLRSASFDDPTSQGNVALDPKHKRLPEYPIMVLDRAAVSGTVYLVLRYDREGRIHELDVEQVNLRVIGTESQMALWRKALGDACVSAARSWRMLVPEGAIAEGERYGTGRVPVSFEIEEARPPRYGRWEAYIPGPRKVIPWWDDTPMAASAPEALAPGTFHDAVNGRRLLTPLAGG